MIWRIEVTDNLGQMSELIETHEIDIANFMKRKWASEMFHNSKVMQVTLTFVGYDKADR